jgi:hypothetical protein
MSGGVTDQRIINGSAPAFRAFCLLAHLGNLSRAGRAQSQGLTAHERIVDLDAGAQRSEAFFETRMSALGFVTLLKNGCGFVGTLSYNHAAATTSRHVCRADALKSRCVLAVVRWRWTSKVL